MASHRFFLDEPWTPSVGAVLDVPLTADDLHHAVRVVRVRAGESITIVEKDGPAWVCGVESATADDGLRVNVAERAPDRVEPDVTLVCAIAKGTKTDLVVEKAVEIGVARVVPLVCERGVVRLDAQKAEKRRERWSRVARAAAAQSQRAFVPPVELPITIGELAARVPAYDAVVVAWEDEHGASLGEAAAGLASSDSVALVIGPEGGFTSEEVAALKDAGARPVSLGETILRSETASIVSAALIVYELGGLGGRSRG